MEKFIIKPSIGISLLILLIIFNSCSNKKDYPNDILGKWKIDSLLNYDYGKETMMRLDANENIFIGSITNPYYCNFTKHNEFYFSTEARGAGKIYSYAISDDSIVFKEKTSFKIITINEDKLVFLEQVQWLSLDNFELDTTRPKHIKTYYFTKVK